MRLAVTPVHTLPTRTFARTLVPVILATSIAFGLTGCTDDEKEKQSLSTPYAADPLDAPLYTASIPVRQNHGVFIQLPTGLPTELASLLLARIQEASVATGLPLAKTGTIPEITIKGVARAGIAADGTAVALVWEVIDADGQRLKMISDDALIRRSDASPLDRFDPWATVDAKSLEGMADQTAREIAGWYQTDYLSPDESNLATASLTADTSTDTSAVPPAEKPALAAIDFTTPTLLAGPETVAAEPSDAGATETGMAARDATLTENLTPTPSAATQNEQVEAAPEVADPAIITATISRPTAPVAAHTPVDTSDAATDEPIVTASLDHKGAAPSGRTTRPSRNFFDVAVGTSPGNGQLALAAAVQEALLDLPTGTDAPRAFRILGEVTLSKAEAGKAHVTIEWSVAAKDGAPLGLVTQSNIVEAKEISGTWGPLATRAGSAAARGILELINPTEPKA